MGRAGRLLGATALGVAAWGVLIEPQLFTLRRHTIPVLPDGARPLRILQLSDLHLAPWQRRKIDWTRSLARLRPDLVVLTGDQMGHIEARGDLLHALRPFSGIPTVFVHGSNDYYGPILKNPFKYLRSYSRRASREMDIDTAALTQGYEDLGFVDLNNSATRFTLRGTDVELFGLGDPHIRYDDADRMRAARAELAARNAASAKGATGAQSAKSTQGAKRASGASRPAPAPAPAPASAPVRLGVVHAPYQESLNVLLREGADLLLAGHTHGGQVRVPGIGALTANCDVPLDQARGLSVWYDAEHAAYLNVSAGLGGSIYSNIRFACRPEASLITLAPPRP